MVGRLVAVGLPILAGVALAALPGLLAGPSLDAAVFDVVGWQLSEGAQLYVDIWDHKPPATYFLPALLEGGIGQQESWPVIWLTWVVCWAVVAAVSGWLVARMGTRPFAAPLALLVAIGGGQYLLSLGGGLSEPVATLAAVIGLAMVAASSTFWRWAAAGFLAACAVLVSVQLAPAMLAFLVLVGWQTGARFAPRAVTFAGGAVLAGVLVLGPWLVGSRRAAAVDALVDYNAAYRLAAPPGAEAFTALPWTVLAVILPVALAGAGLLALRRTSAGPLPYAAVAWLVGAAGMTLIQGRFYSHHAIPLLVPLAILAAVALQDFVARVGTRPSLRRAAAGVVALLLLVSIAFASLGAANELGRWRRDNERIGRVAEWLQTAGITAESMLVWGDQPYLYRVVGSRPAIRYPYLLPLTTPGYASSELIHELASELSAEPPTVVVDAGSTAPGLPGSPPLLIPRPVATEGRDLDLLGPLRDLVAQRYVLATTVDGWPVYVLGDR